MGTYGCWLPQSADFQFREQVKADANIFVFHVNFLSTDIDKNARDEEYFGIHKYIYFMYWILWVMVYMYCKIPLFHSLFLTNHHFMHCY